MLNQNNDGMLFGDEDVSPAEVPTSDITLSSDDKKDTPPEDKKEEEPKVEPKTEETPKDEPSDKKEDEPKEESKAEENAEDLDLSDLFADLEDSSAANDESKKILEDVAAGGGTITPEQVKELEAQIAIQKEINTKLTGQVKKLMNDSVDLSYKNAELEAFGGVNTNPNILILSKNLDKAQAGDDKSKSKVISVLKTLYEEFTGEDLEKTKISEQTDLLSAVDSYNSSSNPNIKSKSSDTIEGISM